MFPKRGAAAIAVTTVALILLLSFKTPDQVVGNSISGSAFADTATAAPTTAGGTTAGGTTTTPAATSAPTTGSGATATPAGATVSGPVVDTQFGPVQVSITVSGGKVTDITAMQLPSGGHSGRISRAAEPLLREQALQAQSANIDGVSGATYTSEAYAQSLQAALDQAGI